MHAKYFVRLIFPFLIAASATVAADEGRRCVGDLEETAKFLPVNDSGAAAAIASRGPAIEAAFQKARSEAAHAADAAACETVLRTYLRAWRSGHLAVVPATTRDAAPGGDTARPDSKVQDDPRAPKLKVLSKDTLLLVLATFNDRYTASVEALIAKNRAVLESHKNWIIDVRANGGGSDSTYAPLLPWLLDTEYPVHRVEWLVTPANIRAQETICAITSDPKACATQMDPVVAKMRAAEAGSYVLGGSQRITYESLPKRERKAPARVAVLIDKGCGSSCEQFVLEVRTGFRVKLVGRPTGGYIDVSNMRKHALPSGRTLYYATSRSTRLPDMHIDEIGLAPDVLLPKPADEAGREAEVRQVQRWLEGGSLRP